MRLGGLALFVVLGLGCGSDKAVDTTADDADGSTPIDGGTSGDDGGGPDPRDGGSSLDDGGSSLDDGGSSLDDGGSSLDDGGSSVDDGGPADGGAAGCPEIADCTGRVCGRDPVCGVPCGECGADETCRVSECRFGFSAQLFGPSATLSAWVESLDRATGVVRVNGVETRPIVGAFTFDWGDGTTTEGFFAQDHDYEDVSRNYVVRVTSNYEDGSSYTVLASIELTAPAVAPIALPAEYSVAIPDGPTALAGRGIYDPPRDLTFFDDGLFPVTPRSTVEYVLSLAADVQRDFCNDDLVQVGAGFPQVILRSANFPGMGSLWFTDPVAVVSGDWGFSSGPQYSSLFHELGHNATLNTPSAYITGGKIDGNANTIYSEAMAQIFQYATTVELVNGRAAFGLPDDLVTSIKLNAIATVRGVRQIYEDYVAAGAPFNTYDDPFVPDDTTFGTFITIAYTFLVHAEETGEYAAPLRRMMTILQLFDESLHARYDQFNDSAAGELFRSTWMVTALSYAFQQDLRAEMRALNFPVDDATYEELYP